MIEALNRLTVAASDTERVARTKKCQIPGLTAAFNDP